MCNFRYASWVQKAELYNLRDFTIKTEVTLK